ncbi:alpha/beta hydrolase family protein [Chryseobacterium schmidteae]|uniref:alpha/beta hydrolase family protein n=1 Tax=Chryseobacterium schmidteae TaxID=2730404 RepID=UPI00158C92C0|nr:prolyl oligopeptidase family serine peptidase [Chryseobacterium schmidteae]
MKRKYNTKVQIHFILCIFTTLLFSCETKSQKNDSTYLNEKKHFHSKLIKKEKAPQEYEDLVSTKDLLRVEYPSNGINLKALIIKKNIDSTKRKPILVYLHGGFALGEQDLLDCQVFTKQGYIVFTPSYRGENGNGGNFELFQGEVDDAKEAIKWIAKQPFADSTKIYVFGHSIGGGVSSLLSLENNVPIAKSGSSGGLYTQDFYGWEDIIPFDNKNPLEGKMRVLVENIPSMQINHYAIVGKEDEGLYDLKDELNAISHNSKLKLVYIDGDHFTSLEPAMKKFIEIINNEKK